MASVDIVNMALRRLGEAPITTLAGTDTVSVMCNSFYAHTVQELLRSHRWNFAIKRTLLTPSWVAPTSIAESGDGEFSITKATHGRSTGDRVTFSVTDDYPADNYPQIIGTWRVTVVSSSVFTLDDSTFDGSGAVDTAYALAGYFDWEYSIAEPSDCLRALEDDREEANLGVEWVPESGRILTHSDELEFRYIEDVTDVTRFDPLFLEVLVLKLAIKFERALRGQEGSSLAAEYLQVTAPLARRIDANEGQSRGRDRLFPRQSLFVAARRGFCEE